ncbi:9085_t:CDS:2, partial [Scutellospora calospora]
QLSLLNEFNNQDSEEQLSLLSQILNKLNDKDHEEVWININSILERIFGYDQIFKSSNNDEKHIGTLNNDQTLPSTQRVVSANKVSSGNLNDQTLSLIQRLREKINTSNNDVIESNVDKESNIETIKQNLVEYNKFGKNKKIEKLKHFISVKHHYNNLCHVATQETPPESNSLNNKQKAFVNILFGKNLPQKFSEGLFPASSVLPLIYLKNMKEIYGMHLIF